MELVISPVVKQREGSELRQQKHFMGQFNLVQIFLLIVSVLSFLSSKWSLSLRFPTKILRAAVVSPWALHQEYIQKRKQSKGKFVFVTGRHRKVWRYSSTHS